MVDRSLGHGHTTRHAYVFIALIIVFIALIIVYTVLLVIVLFTPGLGKPPDSNAQLNMCNPTHVDG